MNIESLRKRNLFNDSADDYNQVRPSYPISIFDFIIKNTGINQKSKALEIGCGTGQATIYFAKIGLSIIALDIGEKLLVKAKENCKIYPKVSFINSSFEDINLETKSFDIIYSATAFHWIDPDIKYKKTASLLKDDGYLCIIENQHPTPFTGFFKDVQAIYDEIVPEWKKPKLMLTTEEKINMEIKKIHDSGLYNKVKLKKIAWEKTFSSDEYIQLLNTFSDHRNLEKSRKEILFTRIKKFIIKEYDNLVIRPYLTVCYLAKKNH